MKEITVHFDGLSEKFSLHGLEMTFVSPSDDLWCPVLSEFILEPSDQMFTDRCQEVMNAAVHDLNEPDEGTHVGTMNIHFGSADGILIVDARELKITENLRPSLDSRGPVPMSVRLCVIIHTKAFCQGGRRMLNSIREEEDGREDLPPLSHPKRLEATQLPSKTKVQHL